METIIAIGAYILGILSFLLLVYSTVGYIRKDRRKRKEWEESQKKSDDHDTKDRRPYEEVHKGQ